MRAATCSGAETAAERLRSTVAAGPPPRARTPSRIWVSLWLRMKGLSRFFTILCCGGARGACQRADSVSSRRGARAFTSGCTILAGE